MVKSSSRLPRTLLLFSPISEADVVEEPSWWERAGMELPNTIVKLKDIATFDGTDGVWRLD